MVSNSLATWRTLDSIYCGTNLGNALCTNGTPSEEQEVRLEGVELENEVIRGKTGSEDKVDVPEFAIA